MGGAEDGAVVEERFRALARSIPDAVVQADASGRIVGWNPAATEMFGHEREEILGEPLKALMPERYHDAYERGLRRFFETGERNVIGSTVQLHGRRADGSEFPLELTLGTWVSDGDRYFGGVIRDVTERAEREEQLERALETWKEFGYGISHDLKEPLRTLEGHLQLIERASTEALSEELQASLKHAMEGAERMERRIDALLAYTRVETRGEAFEPTDLGHLVEDVRNDIGRRLGETEALLETSIDAPKVRVDPAQIGQVLQNLLENAVKYSGDEPPEIEIEATPQTSREVVEVRVRDAGVGIDPEAQEDVFQLFHQAHQDAEGSGIGLALCRRIVQRHGGRIGVESTPGEGTTVWFTLPTA